MAKWEKLFHDYGDDYTMYRTIDLHRLLLEGVPYEYKARVWGICSGALAEMRLNPHEYEALLVKSTRTDCSQLTMEEIERDLHRWVSKTTVWVYLHLHLNLGRFPSIQLFSPVPELTRCDASF